MIPKSGHTHPIVWDKGIKTMVTVIQQDCYGRKLLNILTPHNQANKGHIRHNDI